jgi:lipooligosaccharide transport system permease protein
MEANARAYRRIWKGNVVTTFLGPVLFLAAMGLGLGSLVDRHGTSALNGVSYLAFLGPGLLVATAMQTGAAECTWPVMAGIKWLKTFHAVLATPVGITDLVIGFLMWLLVRLLMVGVAFVLVMAAFGAVPLGGGLLAIGPALLTGMAFAAPLVAFTAVSEKETRLSSVFRFGIMPMFLFSGTFFPVSQLPSLIRPIAYATPLWHGVELARTVATPIPPTMPSLVHVAYLLVWILGGTYLAVIAMRRRLQP